MANMKKVLKKEVVIGLCAILALGILFFGIEYLKGVNILKPSNYYYSVYNNVKGLTVSSPVNFNGVKVGQVDNVKIMYDRPGCVLVQFSIDKNLRLTEGRQSILDRDLLGTASLKLEIAQSDKFYKSGDTIPSVVAGGMMDQISQNIMPGISNIMPKLDSIMANLNAITSNPALNQSLNNLEAITTSLKTTVEVLNTSAAHLPTVMNDVQSVVNNVDSISSNLNILTENLANSPIDETIKNLNSISEQLVTLTESINSEDSNVGKLLNGTELYDNLVKATADIDSLLVDIKQNPKRYISIKLL